MDSNMYVLFTWQWNTLLKCTIQVPQRNGGNLTHIFYLFVHVYSITVQPIYAKGYNPFIYEWKTLDHPAHYAFYSRYRAMEDHLAHYAFYSRYRAMEEK